MTLATTCSHWSVSSRWATVPKFQDVRAVLVSHAVASDAALIASAQRVQASPATSGTIVRTHEPIPVRRVAGASSRHTPRSAKGATQNAAVVIFTIVARQPMTSAAANQPAPERSRQRRPARANAIASRQREVFDEGRPAPFDRKRRRREDDERDAGPDVAGLPPHEQP